MGPMRLYIEFFKLSSMTFGGGMVLVAMARDRLVRMGLLDQSEAMEMTNLASLVPGPVAINFAALAGNRAFGPLGSAASVLGVVSPPFISVLVIGPYLISHGSSHWVKGFVKGVLCASSALMLRAVLQSARHNLKRIRGSAPAGLLAFLGLYFIGVPPLLALGGSIGGCFTWEILASLRRYRGSSR